MEIEGVEKGSKYKFGEQYKPKNNQTIVNDNIWKDLSKNYDQIRLLEPQNQSNIYHLLSKTLFTEKFLKTDIVYLARVNRQKIVDMKYKIINLLYNKDLNIFYKTIFVSDNINAVRHVFHTYQDKLYYYFRNNYMACCNHFKLWFCYEIRC